MRRICAISCSLIEDPWKTPDRVVLDFLKKRENKIKGASEEIFDRIKNELDAETVTPAKLAELEASLPK